MAADEKMLADVKAYLGTRSLEFTESEEQDCTKLTLKSGKQRLYVSVFGTGTIRVQGPPTSQLKAELDQMKARLEAGEPMTEPLPYGIDELVDAIQRVPDVDPVIVAFISEAIDCCRAKALLAATFMLGAASENAINHLIQTYVAAISEEKNRNNIVGRMGGKTITGRYEVFEKSYRSCKSKPTALPLAQDLDTIIGQTFHFYRVTRNEIGHPVTVPNLEYGAILANLGQFGRYIERVYGLIAHFRASGVVV